LILLHWKDDFHNREDVKYGSLRLIDLPAEMASHLPWFNQTLTVVNDAARRIKISVNVCRRYGR